MSVIMPDAKSFMEELEKDHELVERKIVRLAYRYKPTSAGVVYRLSVVGTARIAGQTVKFEEGCGELWGMGLDDERNGFSDRDQKVYEKAEKLADRIKTGCAELELEVRAGTFTAGRPERQRAGT